MKRTFRDVLSEAAAVLKGAGVPEPENDAWLLFRKNFRTDRGNYLLNADVLQELSGEDFGQFQEELELRRRRIPLQHILGETEFMGLPFRVNENVLIPRPDTETLAELVLKNTQERTNLSLLDLCTGSGCLAVSLARLGNFTRVAAADISGEALQVAKENAARNGVDITFSCGDLFEGVEGRFDVIVSNPPYIPAKVIDGLEPEVKDHEPGIALNGGEDGLTFYRRIAGQSPRFFTPGGALYLEIGYDQGDAVQGILAENGFTGIRLEKDLSGNDRVVYGVIGAAGQHVF